jgi:AbrB family looped-hinge helix DNA binding protein
MRRGAGREGSGSFLKKKNQKTFDLMGAGWGGGRSGDAVLLLDRSKDKPVDAAITAKGQATIPKLIRDHLGLKPGDRVKFFLHPDGSVVLLPKLRATALRGMVQAGETHVTLEDMDAAVSARAARRSL